MNIVTIIGARPQFIKAGLVSREFANHNIQELIVHTGQHYDKNMSDVFFEEMHIPRPAYNLGVQGGNHGAATGQMLEKIEKVLLAEKPDGVLVYGDTNSTLAGALAASKLHIKLIHVEAGLRSFNMKMPEEINRILTDRISDFLFCPTQTAFENLTREGFDNFKRHVEISGDVMYDSALFYETISGEKVDVSGLTGGKEYVLATVHRAENTDNIKNLTSIIRALNHIHKKINVIFPVHPRTRKVITDQRLACDFTMIDPVGYMEMIQLTKNSSLVLTDSGGLQKEAFFFKKYCVTLRDQTEWVELAEKGYNIIAGTEFSSIIQAFERMINMKSDFKDKLYGDGKASGRIVASIKNSLK